MSRPASAWAWTAASSASWTQRSIRWLRRSPMAAGSGPCTTQAGTVGLPGDVGSEKATAGEIPRRTARHRSWGE